jgi:hypothetical protein
MKVVKLSKSSNRFISRDSNGNRAEGLNHDVVQFGGAVRTVALSLPASTFGALERAPSTRSEAAVSTFRYTQREHPSKR